MIEQRDLKVTVELIDLALTQVVEADMMEAGVAMVSPLKNGILFGQIKVPFQQPQPDGKGLLQDSFSRPSCESLIVHR